MEAEQLYTIGEVAAILGVSTHTIRAWERRHGMVRPIRTRTMWRMYREEDIDLMRNVRLAANLNGVSLKLAYQHVTGSQVIEPRISETQKRGSERLLPLSEGNLWRGVVDAMPHPVTVIEPDGSIVESKIATAKLFGVVRQRLQGRMFASLVDPADRVKAEMLYNPSLRAVRGWNLNLATPNGSRWYSFQSWFVRQERDMLLVLVGSPMFDLETADRPLDG
jgi:PAS domain-containing protein